MKTTNKVQHRGANTLRPLTEAEIIELRRQLRAPNHPMYLVDPLEFEQEGRDNDQP